MAARTVVGAFRSEDQADKAVRELRSHGFGDNEISVIGRDTGRHGRQGQDQGHRQGQSVTDGGAWGAGIGGAAGLAASAGLLAIPGIGPILAMGPLAATLAGAATGGLTGGLVDWGVPENEGRDLERRVKEGEFLCLLRTERNAEDARLILQQCGGEDIHINEAKAPAGAGQNRR